MVGGEERERRRGKEMGSSRAAWCDCGVWLTCMVLDGVVFHVCVCVSYPALQFPFLPLSSTVPTVLPIRFVLWVSPSLFCAPSRDPLVVLFCEALLL